MVNIGENILESLKIRFMDLPPYVFDVDYVVKIRSELSITVLEKKNKITEQKSELFVFSLFESLQNCLENYL